MAILFPSTAKPMEASTSGYAKNWYDMVALLKVVAAKDYQRHRRWVRF